MLRLRLILVLYSGFLFSQKPGGEIRAFQKDLNALYLDPETAPLTEGELNGFPEVHFFSFDENYTLEAVVNI